MKKTVFLAFMLLMAVAMQGQVTFTAAEWANAQSLSNGAAVTGYSQDGVTVEFAQGTGSNAVVWNTSQNAIVTRQGNTMTVSVADGQVITSASFTMKQNSHANALSGSTWSEGSAEANNTVATWTGSAQTITVTIGGTALFDSFTITAEVPEVPFVEDESTYNDTTIITPQEIADENFMGAGDEFESLSYSKEGKQLMLSKNDYYYPMTFASDYYWPGLALRVYPGHSITISAPYRIKKIILHNVTGENDYVWIGNSTQVDITDAYLNILDITIISDATDSSPYTVNFYGLNGALLKTEQVPVGGSATAPVVSHECFDGWDKDFSVVHSDLDVHAVATIATQITASEWESEQWSSLSYSKDGYTVTASYVNRTGPNWWGGYICFTPGDAFTISRNEVFRQVVIECSNESNAVRLAASQCNTGALSRTNKMVYWSGETSSLTVTRPANSEDNFDIKSFNFSCEYYEQVSCTVIFVNEAGQEIARETVLTGESLTNIPAGPAHEDECMEFAGWDVTDFSHIITDLTVHPIYRPKAIISLTATEWAESQGGSVSRITKDGFTLYGNISYNSNDSSIVVRRNGGFIILNPDYFYHLTFSCSTEAYATALASNNTWSSGTVVQDGTDVIWTGETDSLSFVGSATHIVSITSLCQHFEVVFLGENDQPISTQSLTSGNSAIAPPAPVHSNECLQFAGWDHEFTHVYGNLTIRPVWNLLDDCVPEGYVKVLFMDLTGDTLDTQFVLIGGSVTETPDAPALKYHTFTGWDHALTNLTENTIIRPVYTFDTNSPDILTVVDYYNLKDTAQERLEEDPVRAIKGMYHAKNNENVEDGRLTFELQWYDGNWLKSTTVYDMLSLNGEPFVSHLDITEGDTVIVFGTYVNEWVEYWGGYWNRVGLKDGYVVWIGAKRAEEGYTNINMPDAATLYDFSGNGLKQAVYNKDNITLLTKDITNDFHSERMLGSANGWPIFIEDVNHDGHADVSHWNFNSLLSSGANYELVEGALFLPNFDANSDGRIDYMLPSSNDIMYQMADGSFRKEHMQIYSYDEFMAQFDETEWISTYSENVSTYSSGSSGLVANTGWSSGMNLSGACLARAPKRRDAEKAPSIGYTVSAVTRALDLNADGYIDLVDEKNGFLYQNMGNSKWIQFNIGRIVQPADLNNDGFTDYIFPGTQLYVMIYQGNGQFDYRNIYSNAAVDDLLYCYDFDHDGDIDILATFSTKHNATNRAYTCFFLNDGQGNFTRQTEQIYGTENLWFSACQDINGDGYMDLLAFRGDITNNWGPEFAANTDIEIVWLQGNANKTFSNPQLLYTIASPYDYAVGIEGWRINAEDLDNDGKAEIWVSGMSLGKTRLFTMADATANVAPTAPAAPTLLYDNGYLTVSWGNGADAQTQTGDLTYALRIGTTAGGNEILAAHANANGTRRNFLDGNMGRTHSYTINLRTYAPAMLYVAVQAIDAQHVGSAWSQEATVEHTYLPAEFELSRKTTPFNEAVEVHYTELPGTYTHTWDWAGGTVNGNLLSYSTAGEKIITHTVTAPNGKAASYSVTLTVLPNGVSTEVTSGDLSQYLLGGGYYDNVYTFAFNDFNQDGNLDVLLENVVYTGASPLAFIQAAGLWNTQLSNASRWLDWNKNGSADLLMIRGNGSSYLPHQENAPDMASDEVADSRLNYFYGLTDASYNYYRTLKADLLNIGQPTFVKYQSGTNLPCYFLIPSGDDYRQVQVTTDGEPDRLKDALLDNSVTLMTDCNRDGWMDVAIVPYDSYNWVYNRMLIFENQGNAQFHQIEVPFSQTIAQDDFSDAQLMDLNGDGYIDIIATINKYNDPANNATYVLWNNANTSFSAPEILLSGEAVSVNFLDLNNDGYTDIAALRRNKAAGNSVYGWYVWYMGPQGIVSHGFLNATESTGYGWYNVLPNRLFVDDQQYVPATYDEHGYEISYEGYANILREVESAAVNVAPQAPANLRAVATTEGILIEWNDAADDHTPANKMRYNLSVKHAGQSGAGAYVISPQNGGNAQAAYLPAYPYLESNRILVSKDVLTAGNYEISVQAIDQRNLMSAFSNTVTLHFDRQAIEAPTTVCTGEQAAIVYMGGESGTPTWNFNGGTVVSGTALGTQYVQWSTPGMKTITLTMNGKTHSRMIYVDSNDANVTLPSTLVDGTEITIPLPANMDVAWYIDIDGSSHTVTPRGIDGRDKQLTISDGVLAFNTQKASVSPLTNFSSIYLTLELTNANGCTQTITQLVHIIASAKPVIKMVTTDASGHYVIHWDNSIAEAFSQIVVLKETNVLDQFVEVGTAQAVAGSFTDRSSDASQKAERYAIRAMSDGGGMSAVSPVHQSVHMTINRGMNDMTWNLIWNQYSGTDVVSYNILRGSSESTLTQIASVSAVNTSYTDVAVGAQPYYAIEFVLRGQTASSSPVRRMIMANVSGRSNIVNSNAARTVTYATSLSIQSANGQYATTADKTMLLLYAEVLPSNTTYKNVVWEITSGNSLATIDRSSGLLTANTPNNGGTVTVKATTTDGTNVTATKQITIGAISDDTPVVPVYYTIRFENWNGTLLENISVLEGTMPVYSGATPTRPDDEQFTYTFTGWTPEIVAAVANATYTATYSSAPKQQGLDVDDQQVEGTQAHKVLINGTIYILRGDKVYTLTGQMVR